MIHQPRFKRCFRYEIVPNVGVFLLSEKEQFLLKGSPYICLAPLLDGQHTIEQILALTSAELSAPEVFYVLDRLKHQGYIVDANTSLPPDRAAFWEMLGVPSEIATERLQEITISVVSFGSIETTPFSDLLGSLGVTVSESGDLVVALTDDYLQDDLEALNQKALQLNRPWMLIKPVGIEIWIGPIFIPGKTGCWECLAQRLRSHRKVENYLQQRKNTPKPLSTSISALPSTLQTALSIAATEAAKWIVCNTFDRRSDRASLEGKILTINTLTLEKQEHILTQRPQCSGCGDPSATSAIQSAPLLLQNRKKLFTRDGGHRTLSPEQTFQKYGHHVSPITGIIGNLQRISTWENEEGLTPSYSAGYGFFGEISDLNELQESLRCESYGKGKSNVQAKVSALCEAIERYGSVFQGDEARIQAQFKDLENAIHPNDCMLYSDRQFANRDQWNATCHGFNWIPETFDENAQIDWSAAWSLTHNQPRYVPTSYCYKGYPDKKKSSFARADSNGCAVGNNLEDAILQGFMELVERDSIALWWYNRLNKPQVDLSSFNEPYFQELVVYYQQIQRDLWIIDITSDLDIPVFAAISRRNNGDRENIILGFGAHFDAKIALLRALTEINQSLPAALLGMFAADSAYRERDRETISWWHEATILKHPYLIPDRNLPLKTPANYPQCWSDDLLTDVTNCVEIVAAKGLETIVLNQTRPDLGLCAVKVIVPGLRHFWPRFGAGRLYNVPVKMGWLAAPLTEEQLNPTPAFF